MTRKPDLTTPTSRRKLRIRKRPYTRVVVRGGRLAYRRNAKESVWSSLIGGRLERFAIADDREPADGRSVMTYDQAAEHVRQLVRGPGDHDKKPVTVEQAIDAYAKHLREQGREPGNASRVTKHLTPDLASATVASLKCDDLSSWRAGLIAKGLKAATADRIARVAKAALALAASDDKRITNAAAWQVGLKKLKGADKPKEPEFLTNDVVCALVAAAHQVSQPFGMLVDVMAQTGNRFSQLVRLTVADLIDTPPTLMIPSSKKGGKDPRHEHVPISAPLAAALRGAAAADGRTGAAPLLVDSNGAPWRREVDPLAWREIIDRVGLDEGTTSYALRHSNIQRQLLASVPIILVAKSHDTSCLEVEKTYARTIARIKGASDKVRAALLDTTPPAGANVIPLRRG